MRDNDNDNVAFDMDEFLGASVAEPISVDRPQVPPGRYMARIGDIQSGKDITSWIAPPKGAATSPQLRVPYVILDEGVKLAMNRKVDPVHSQGYFLNLLQGTSHLDPKNNADLGQLLAAARIPSTGGFRETLNRLPGAGPFYVTVEKNAKGYTNIVKIEAVA